MKTTKKHFEIFKAEALKWIDFFGLKDWEVEFAHIRDDENMAACTTRCTNRWAKLSLSTVWTDVVSDYDVRKCAFHEVVELFIAPLFTCAHSRYISEHEIKEADHMIVRTLENVIFEKQEKKRVDK